MYKLSKRSYNNLLTCHEDLQKIMGLAIQVSPVDFIITEGHRSVARQFKLFLQGLSKVDGTNTIGKHNLTPSMACDICAYVRGNKKLAFDVAHLAAIGGAVFITLSVFLILQLTTGFPYISTGIIGFVCGTGFGLALALSWLADRRRTD